jgi:hypothetical protein
VRFVRYAFMPNRLQYCGGNDHATLLEHAVTGEAYGLGNALLDPPVQAPNVAIFYVIVQQIESNIVEPNIMARRTDMPPLLVLFALLAGGLVAGVLGAIIAIPLAGALRILVLRVVAPAVRRWTGVAGG